MDGSVLVCLFARLARPDSSNLPSGNSGAVQREKWFSSTLGTLKLGKSCRSRGGRGIWGQIPQRGTPKRVIRIERLLQILGEERHVGDPRVLRILV